MRDELKKMLGIIPDDDGVVDTDEPHIDYVPVVFKPAELPSQYDDDVGDKIDDYKKVRGTLTALMDMTGEALAKSMELVNENNHPRSIEAFTGLANTLKDTAKAVLEVHDKMKEENQSGQPSVAIQQNNYYGTTSDIIKQRRAAKANEVIDVDGD